jgi:thiosulfate/3-mercaptopyruvate sulfurtransferase
MKTSLPPRFVFTFLFLMAATLQSIAQQGGAEPWRESQLMPPSVLAAIINNPGVAKPVIYSIGPSAVIKGSIDIGAGAEQANLNKLKKEVSKLPRETSIVIYCGCCPFKRCPNIRPAFELLNQMKLTNHQLLNLAQNIKIDWIDKGYPTTSHP